MTDLDAAERLALDYCADLSFSRLVIWGEDIRHVAEAATLRWPDVAVSCWNDFASSSPGAGCRLVLPAGGGGIAGHNDAATLVLMRLPKSLGALADWLAELTARFPRATIVAAGMVKHMTLSQNELIRQRFARLDVSLARQKARLLIASEPLDEQPPAPEHPLVELGSGAGAASGLRLDSRGGVFASGRLDVGTRLLLDTLDARLPADGTERLAVDLGCGSGVIAAWLARRGYRVLASDRSRAAVAATEATARANDVRNRISVAWCDALEGVEPPAAPLVVLNPPFHDRAAVTIDPAIRLFAAAAQALAPGGQLVTVWNSHLRYRAQLERLVGRTEQWARNAKFTVTVSVRPGA